MHSGAMAAIQILATSMRAMRLTTGTRLRFLMLNSRQFKMFVTGGSRRAWSGASRNGPASRLTVTPERMGPRPGPVAQR